MARDPRGVMASRANLTWFKPDPACGDVHRLCADVQEDYDQEVSWSFLPVEIWRFYFERRDQDEKSLPFSRITHDGARQSVSQHANGIEAVGNDQQTGGSAQKRSVFHKSPIEIRGLRMANEADKRKSDRHHECLQHRFENARLRHLNTTIL